jgi:thiamine biosynthesis lipoprotein ApbE
MPWHFSIVTASVLAALLCGPCTSESTAAEDFVFHHENVMGTSLELFVRAEHPQAAHWAEIRVLEEIDRLSLIFSGYDTQSELSRWQRASRRPVKLSPELFEVLRACDSWRRRSDGAFDPRVQSLARLWSRCAAQNRIPDSSELGQALALMQRSVWNLDEASLSAERLSDCPITLDGIAKGYIVEKACAAALDRGRGVRGIMLNVGGDLRACGERAQTVGVASPWADSESSQPITYVSVKDCSVATSGSSQRGFRIDGRWYSHIFDPRTGRPVEPVVSASVIARSSIDADVLAKVFNVLRPDESLRLAGSLAGVACLIITSDGKIIRSDAWKAYEVTGPPHLAHTHAPDPVAAADERAGETKLNAKASGAPAWAPEHELVVNFELNRPEESGGRYRRPYVAVWVEDKHGFPVRTLALWVSFGGAGPFEWLPDLRRWYKSDLDRKKIEQQEILFTVSRPTRPPGKYKVIWDGKDNQGKQLPGGEYELFIEAAREHGTYQSIRKQVILADKPFTQELKGNVEIKSASVEYRRKAQGK